MCEPLLSLSSEIHAARQGGWSFAVQLCVGDHTHFLSFWNNRTAPEIIAAATAATRFGIDVIAHPLPVVLSRAQNFLRIRLLRHE
jgi:hypothetical protein